MDISTKRNTPEIKLVRPQDVPRGRVYAWGTRSVSYLRVGGGSICLSGSYEYLPLSHSHFLPGTQVEIGTANLCVTYEG